MEPLIILLFIILIGISTAAFFAAHNAFFPGRVETVRQIASSMHGRSFLLGLVNFLFFFAVLLGLITLGERFNIFLIPAVFLLSILAIGLVFGLSGVVQLVGMRVFPAHDELQRTLRGSILLYLACLTPWIGWFGLLVYAGVLGLGAFLLSFFPKPAPADEAIPEE